MQALLEPLLHAGHCLKPCMFSFNGRETPRGRVQPPFSEQVSGLPGLPQLGRHSAAI